MSPEMPSDFLARQDPLFLLKEVRQFLPQKVIAEKLQVAPKTISRWERRATSCPLYVEPALREILRSFATNPENTDASFTFIDLFAGIGGIRMGFEAAGGRCVLTSEWNQWAQQTYVNNFGHDGALVGDITQQTARDIPDHDVLLAGFPCQPFSIAGVSKKNALGRPHGFECTTQGTLFFEVARIIAAKRPKAFLLENVKNLVSHDHGNTFRVILHTLQRDLGYSVSFRIINAAVFVPQHRERILIAGFREETGFSFETLKLPDYGPLMKSILHPENGSEKTEDRFTTGPLAKVHAKYVLTNKLWAYLRAYAAKHKAAGNGFGFGLVDGNSVSRTLSARYYKDGSEILVSRGKGKNPRRLTPRECARLMGFPDNFKIEVSDTQAYKQFGNSVVVPVIEAVAHHMRPHILALKQFEETGVFQPSLVASA
jgi:DNA (cytosine-5)-methyltransferase 1